MSNLYKWYNRYLSLGNIKRKRELRKNCKKNVHSLLDKSHTIQVDNFWKDYCKVNPIFHSFYSEKTGKFSEQYMPDDVYYTKIDTYYNDWLAASIMDNKCLYDRYFPADIIKQPETIIKRINGFYFDSQGMIISLEQVTHILKKLESAFLKKSVDSAGGHGVCYLSGTQLSEKFWNCANNWNEDFIMQIPIEQCKELQKINKSSVNTIRLLSLLDKFGNVTIYSCILRMGIGDSKVDNASSGGITCGINDDGSLKNIAYSAAGEKYFIHPTSKVKFDTVTIPNFQSIKDVVKKLHQHVPSFRLLSWDIAVEENGAPILVECNFHFGELDFHQLNNGPLFGEDTIKILEEVFH